MVYLDARSQCGSTHGSTSDDTGSSMSTVVDRFSTSDRVSTISTASTGSTAGSEQQTPSEFSGVDRDLDRSSDRDVLLSRAICPLEHLERDFSNPPDYLLRRLANSEAVTHVESRGEVERITAVVAPNTVLIEETITLQPPLSFQDAPLSYGHEARPDLFYTADLAADSTTHFRPIKDDVELVERVNGNHTEEFHETTRLSGTKISNVDRSSPPPLPARNHVNRISVNQTQTQSESANEVQPRASATVAAASPEREFPEAPLLPPKPLPRKDVRTRRKRPPPPPPPPIITPRREIKPAPSIESNHMEEKEARDIPRVESAENAQLESRDNSSPNKSNVPTEENRGGKSADSDARGSFDTESEMKRSCANNTDAARSVESTRTNKVLEIIEMRMARGAQTDRKEQDTSTESKKAAEEMKDYEQNETKDESSDKNELPSNLNKILTDRSANLEANEAKRSDELSSREEKHVKPENPSRAEKIRTNDPDTSTKAFSSNTESSSIDNSALRENEDDETYRSLDEVNDDMKSPEMNRILEDEEIMEEEDTTDESDDGYYWQSNLATIGEEEETTSLEYVNA